MFSNSPATSERLLVSATSFVSISPPSTQLSSNLNFLCKSSPLAVRLWLFRSEIVVRQSCVLRKSPCYKLLARFSDSSNLQKWPSKSRSLVELCHALKSSYFELCVQNAGRPAAAALNDFVTAATEAFLSGYSRERLSLQLAYGGESGAEFKLTSAGYRLTSSEEAYCIQWLDAVYLTLQCMRVCDNEASRGVVSTDQWLLSIVHRVLEGQRTQDEQSWVKFDRALATNGTSGGVASEKVVISPQWVPISQLVLLTVKVFNEGNETELP